MTNYEYYKDRIAAMIDKGKIAVKSDSGELVWCSEISCSQCAFDKISSECQQGMFRFMFEEYTVDWSKVPVDTKIYVSQDREYWYPRHFAKYGDGGVWAWESGGTAFSALYSNLWTYAKLAEE